MQIKLKLQALLVSFKVHMCICTTILLCLDHINEQTWMTIIIAMAAGRVVTQGVATYKGQELSELEK